MPSFVWKDYHDPKNTTPLSKTFSSCFPFSSIKIPPVHTTRFTLPTIMTTRNSTLTFLLFLAVSFLVVISVNGSTRRLERDEMTGHVSSTREEMLSRRERRKTEFSRKLQQLQQQWDDHISGKVPLKQGFETERLQKKIKAYETKLEHLNQEIDERVSEDMTMDCVSDCVTHGDIS